MASGISSATELPKKEQEPLCLFRPWNFRMGIHVVTGDPWQTAWVMKAPHKKAQQGPAAHFWLWIIFLIEWSQLEGL